MFQFMGIDIVALIVKIFFMSITVLYSIFSFMVVRQVSLMNRSFSSSLSGLFTFLAWTHLFIALLSIIIVFTVL